MNASRRRPPQFNLAFLDIMCCGFGAVVLLVMLLHGDIISARKEVVADLRSEADRLERQVLAGEKLLVSLRNSMEQSEQEKVVTEGKARQVLEQIQKRRQELARLRQTSQATSQHVNALQSDLKRLEQKQVSASLPTGTKQGSQVRSFLGQGDRQYLTGLHLGGKRTLLLVDASASMLDETIVNVIVRRNLDPASRRSAPKWQRTLRTVEWLVANLPTDGSLAIATFNTRPRPLPDPLQWQWIRNRDSKTIDKMVATLRKTAPADGTSLANAFAGAGSLRPLPDSILLLTDGLPTQGQRPPRQTTITGDERLQLFELATQGLPRGVPVNTILFPMEGDPLAAVAFWQLAINTKGSFLTPTRDWP